MNFNALSIDEVTTPEPKPYGRELALLITSDSSLQGSMHMTGPNIYYFAIVIDSFTSIKIVGRMKKPFCPTLTPPATSFAPSFFPLSIYFSTF